MSVIYNKVALIGLGLIASSMFWAMKRGGVAGEVTGYARSEATRDTARRTYAGGRHQHGRVAMMKMNRAGFVGGPNS